jgi:transcriptional regulator with XRE-family HTH domain
MAAEIKSQRIARQMSQEELAHRARLSRTFVGKMELGQHQFSLTALFGLANAFSMPPASLVEGIASRLIKEQATDNLESP